MSAQNAAPRLAGQGRIARTFAALKADGRTGLIPYLTAGDPNPAVTVPVMHALVEAGANILELGVPFSDPMADGPVIQRASERALKHKVSLRKVLEMVRSFRQRDKQTPVVLMGYLNPIEVMGYQVFAELAAAAGVDGVLTVDLPPEEGAPLVEALRDQGLDSIFLLSPTTSEERIARVSAAGSGFLYYVSIKGVTGAAAPDARVVGERLEVVRRHSTLPIGVGFGIRDAASAAALAGVADAVIVGSALVSRAAELADRPERVAPVLAAMLTEMRRALDTARTR